jgi:hypothetical protein
MTIQRRGASTPEVSRYLKSAVLDVAYVLSVVDTQCHHASYIMALPPMMSRSIINWVYDLQLASLWVGVTHEDVELGEVIGCDVADGPQQKSNSNCRQDERTAHRAMA